MFEPGTTTMGVLIFFFLYFIYFFLMLILSSRRVFKDGSHKGLLGPRKIRVALPIQQLKLEMGVKVELVVYTESYILSRFDFLQGPFMDDVRGRDKFLFVGDTNALTRQRIELHQSSLFPFLKGIDIVLKFSSRCNLLVEYTVICEESSA